MLRTALFTTIIFFVPRKLIFVSIDFASVHSLVLCLFIRI